MRRSILGALAVCLAAGGAAAQLVPGVSLPQLPDVPRTVDRVTEGALPGLEGLTREARAAAGRLAREQAARLDALVRQHPERLEMTRNGPAVRGEIVLVDPDPAALAALASAGFSLLEEEQVEGLDLRMARFRVPPGMGLDRAIARARRLAPRAVVGANHLHLQSGGVAHAGTGESLAQRPGPAATVGVIDGGVAAHPTLRSSIQQRGFATGAPQPSNHGTAIASLLAGEGWVRGVVPRARLLVADIYGADPAGGNAVNLVRALGWLMQNGVRVVATSLVGPDNPLVARAVQQARQRGTFIVAPVGNSGAAAPLAYPASYPEVIAVTAVDGRGRVLIEAGRSPNLAYAAPGADMVAALPNGQLGTVRGTSFAVPLVAGRLAHHLGARDPVAALDREASPRERRYGRGLLCGTCRTPIPPR